MHRTKVVVDDKGEVFVERFKPIRRLEHLLGMVTFIVLVLTGFPQSFQGDWSIALINSLGGIEQVRWIHRIAGVVFAIHALVHLAAIFFGLLTKRMRLNLLPGPQDLRDACHNLGYYMGTREEPPPLPKFDYRQKFEYLGMVLGGLVMIGSGFVLLFPIEAASIFPGQFIPAAQVAHSNEALLALLVLVVWHIYGSHLSPEVFPADTTIFSGYISKTELEERHKLEHERLFGTEASDLSDRAEAVTSPVKVPTKR
jgi:formate dehydrogenase subunit gamma